ncbi:MAG: 16S rRNA (cytidine(1402)-2'-O)-methyltransferase [Clostridia bacterium]|nr:16S rRNA (cytidine(1402)-2'-O)-methyltransferase [Clostridia bacterium]
MFYFVSTPIGNLKDITYRAIEVLNSVDIIACEDTRTSLKLLNHYGIKKQLVAYHKFNEKAAAEKLIKEHDGGKNIAVITDAGTPVVSDPGNVLTKELKERGIEFTAIPGATAFTPALILSGLDADRFCFIGFIPEKKSEAEKLLSKYKNLDVSLIFYSAPHDIKKNIGVMYSVFGDRKACAVKEITKIHERAESFMLSEGITEEEPRGEYVIIVEGGQCAEDPLLRLSVEEHVNYYLEKGMKKMDAIKQTAKDRGEKKSDVYAAVNKNEENE